MLSSQGDLTQKSTGNTFGIWAAYPDHKGGCEYLKQFPYYYQMEDVSHDQGFACDGSGCLYNLENPRKIDRLEMNLYIDWNGHYSELSCLRAQAQT